MHGLLNEKSLKIHLAEFQYRQNYKNSTHNMWEGFCQHSAEYNNTPKEERDEDDIDTDTT